MNGERDLQSALERFGEELTERERSASASRLRLPGPAVLMAVIAVIGFGFTPPGRSAASAVAEFAGIGDEPSNETQFVSPENSTPIRDRLDEFRGGDGPAPAPPAADQVGKEIVIGGGDFDGVPYEMFAVGGIQPDGGDACIFLASPPKNGTIYELPGCESGGQRDDALRSRPVAVSLRNSFPADRDQKLSLIAGIARPEVSKLLVTFTQDEEPQTAEADLWELGEELASRIGAPADRSGFALAFDPDPGTAGNGGVMIQALSESGEIVSEQQIGG